MTIAPAPEQPPSRRFRLVRDRQPKARTPTHSAPLPRTGTPVWPRFKHLTQLGWPRNFPIVQFPNAPLIIAFIAGETARFAHGASHADAQAISYLAMNIWAYEELIHGANWFRRLLGLTYVIFTGVHLALALQR